MADSHPVRIALVLAVGILVGALFTWAIGWGKRRRRDTRSAERIRLALASAKAQREADAARARAVALRR